MLTMEVLGNGRGGRVEIFRGGGQGDRNGGIRIIIGEILCLFAYIYCPLFLLPLRLWSQPQIDYAVKIIGVSLHRITTDFDSGYWKLKFSEAS